MVHRDTHYPCALVQQFSTVSDEPDDETGLWMVKPDIHQDGKPDLAIVHLNSVLQATHLIPVYCTPDFVKWSHTMHDTLDEFKLFMSTNLLITMHSRLQHNPRPYMGTAHLLWFLPTLLFSLCLPFYLLYVSLLFFYIVFLHTILCGVLASSQIQCFLSWGWALACLSLTSSTRVVDSDSWVLGSSSIIEFLNWLNMSWVLNYWSVLYSCVTSH